MSFAADTELMFDRFDERLGEIRSNYVAEAARFLLAKTPGPGNQHPADTRYLATGRLRAGWSFTAVAPPATADRWDTGPEDVSTDGRQTAAQIAADARLTGFVPVSYLTNDVAYGYVVHEGLGNHMNRPDMYWTLEVVGEAQRLLDMAVANGRR